MILPVFAYVCNSFKIGGAYRRVLVQPPAVLDSSPKGPSRPPQVRDVQLSVVQRDLYGTLLNLDNACGDPARKERVYACNFLEQGLVSKLLCQTYTRGVTPWTRYSLLRKLLGQLT